MNLLPRRTHTSQATAMLGKPGGFWDTNIISINRQRATLNLNKCELKKLQQHMRQQSKSFLDSDKLSVDLLIN